MLKVCVTDKDPITVLMFISIILNTMKGKKRQERRRNMPENLSTKEVKKEK